MENVGKSIEISAFDKEIADTAFVLKSQSAGNAILEFVFQLLAIEWSDGGWAILGLPVAVVYLVLAQEETELRAKVQEELEATFLFTP